MEQEIYVTPANPLPVPVPVPSDYNGIASAPSTPSQTNANNDRSLDEQQTSQLMSQGYTHGMTIAIGENISAFPLRIWIVDNSGSMAQSDGNRLVPDGKNGYRSASCTRWKEIQDTMDYHIQLAGLLKAPSVFRMLNNPGARTGPQVFGVADKGEAFIPSDVEVAQKTIRQSSPSGVTPLSDHINEIRSQVASLAPSLNSQGCKVAIIIATDGLPSDSQGRGGQEQNRLFKQALRSLEGLPVWIVIRLCTDDENIVDFYNDLDNQLELSIETLDNFTSEAAEVHKVNPWINYSLPLHRMREMGFQNRLFDLLDERPLTTGELRDFCVLLFGIGKLDGAPEPEVDFDAFVIFINNVLKGEKLSWNPVTGTQAPIVSTKGMVESHRVGDVQCSCTIL